MLSRRYTLLSYFLILAVCLNLAKVNVVHADGPTPTEPPPATEVPTEPPTDEVSTEPTEPPMATEVATEVPVDMTPTPDEAITPTETTESTVSEPTVIDENTPVEVILSDVPEDTDVVVLDEAGEPMVLASQAAAEALVASDPVWCPAGISVPTPGLNNCSTSYLSIAELVDAMRNDPSSFDEDGTIFLENPSGPGFTTPLILDDTGTSLGGSYATLSAYNLMVQGGWDPVNGTVSGRTNFGVSGVDQGYVLIGSATNPWAGNITLADLHFDLISAANSVTVHTSSGDIVLSNVEVFQQTGTQYTAYLQSTSGDIIVGDTSFFDGDNSGNADRNKGFYAETTTGSISITGNGSTRTFQDARGNNPANYNGATLSAPIVTLTDVIAQDNDGNGIEILNANVVTLNNVISGKNISGEGNGLSGVLINGTGSTIVTINGGSFNYNGRYGIEILSSGAINTVSNPTYNGNVLGNLYEDTAPNTNLTSTPSPVTEDTTASFSFTGSDNYTSAANLSYECSLDGSAFTACPSPANYSGLGEGSHSFQVRAVDESGNNDSSPESFSWVVDYSAPIISPHGDEFAEATSPFGAVVNYSDPTTFDTVDGAGVASCSPASGSMFALGDTTVTCTATDTFGHAATPTTFVVHVVDTTAPVIDPHSDETAEATLPAGANVNYSLPATHDVADGTGTASCSPAPGSMFALGDTTVTCTATDNAGNAGTPTSFVVHVVDTVPPTIASHGNITISTASSSGIVVNYSSPATSDLVDGSGTASCSPASGSQFPMGTTQVVCTAMDAHGNTATPTTFNVEVIQLIVPAGQTSSSPESPAGSILPVTTGGLVNLHCNSVFWVAGIKVDFINLCDYQSKMHGVDATSLPGALPQGYSFITGLDFEVLYKGQTIQDLPDGSGVRIDFPVKASSNKQFTVLYWNAAGNGGTGQWLEVSQEVTEDHLSEILVANAADELYRIIHVPVQQPELSYPVITTEKLGIFILVTK